MIFLWVRPATSAARKTSSSLSQHFSESSQKDCDDGALDEESATEIALPLSTYFAEGLPWSLLHQVAAEFFTALGAPPSAVGQTSLLHGPMLFKAIWSPAVEALGTLRGWMVTTQAAMGVLVGLLAILADRVHGLGVGASADTTWIWVTLLAVGVCSAVHDIACDGYYMHVFDERRQAKYSGLRVAAFRFAMLVGSSGLVFLGGARGWLWGFGAGALLLIALALAHALFLPRPRTSTATGIGSGTAPRAGRSFAHAYMSFFRQDSALLVIAFLLSYKMADVLMFAMSKVLLGRDLGIGTDIRGVIGFFSITASIAGAVVGGAWVARKGLSSALVPITLLMALTEPLFALLATFAPSLTLMQGEVAVTLETLKWDQAGWTLTLVTLIVVIEQICGGLATAAQVVFIMRRCDPAHKTTHYAFATVIYSVAHIFLGTASGFFFEAVGSALYFWAASVAAIPAVILAMLVPRASRAPQGVAG